MPSHCIESNCEKCATFGHVWAKGMYCKQHAPQGCVDVMNRRCEVGGCEKHPTHGTIGGRPRFCGPHGKERGYENNKRKRCESEGCDKQPTFGPAGRRPSHCKEHGAPLGYVDVINPRCQHPTCGSLADFGPENGRRTHCARHGKELGYASLHKKCAEESCQTTARYGPEGGKPLYCAKHARPHGYRDLLRKRCSVEACTNFASWGLAKATHCPLHGCQLGMRSVLTKHCQEPGCELTANYGLPDCRSTHCRSHGEPKGMIDVVNQRCKNKCGTMTPKSRYDGLCVRCHVYLHPNQPTARNWKTKETHVRQHISELASTDERLKGLQLTFDKAIGGGCSRRRPDAFIECLTHAIVVETDENQHQQNAYDCENKRMMELYQDIGHRPIVFVRFNPDKYVDSEGVVIPSCFQYSRKEGVPLPQKKAWKARLDVLTTQILESVCSIPDRAVTIHELYYDGFKAPQ